jgi:hypothetical protein
MIKKIFLIILLTIPIFLSGKDKTIKSEKKVSPAQVIFSNKIFIKDIYMNKRIGIHGKGEVLEVEVEIENKTDDPLEFYAIIVASYEIDIIKQNSFDMPVPLKNRIKSFVPYPCDLTNFKVLKKSKNQNVSDKKNLNRYKIAINSKLGVNPDTKKPYKLNKKLTFRTYHLSKYKRNSKFFNEVTLLIFNADGSPEYRQGYILTSYRR